MYNYISILVLWIGSVSGFNRRIGITAPIGYFDPLGFSNDKPMAEWVKLREAELKHCRWGMVASVSIPVTELVTQKPAIYALDDINTFIRFVTFVAIGETMSLILGWKNPFQNSSNLFVMNEYYEPGDLGFRPLIKMDNTFMANAELNNGRLAMIGAIGMMSQELIFDTFIIDSPIFDNPIFNFLIFDNSIFYNPIFSFL